MNPHEGSLSSAKIQPQTQWWILQPAVHPLLLRGSSQRASIEQAGGRMHGRYQSPKIEGAASFVRELHPWRGSTLPAYRVYLMLMPWPPFSLWRYLNFSAYTLRHFSESLISLCHLMNNEQTLSTSYLNRGWVRIINGQ